MNIKKKDLNNINLDDHEVLKNTFCCAACRKMKYGKPKIVKIQFNDKKIGKYHKYYYRYCGICNRCLFLRFLSIIIGIVVGVSYCYLFNFLMDLDYLVLNVILFLFFNPLFVGTFALFFFRNLTHCDVDLDNNGNLAKRE